MWSVISNHRTRLFNHQTFEYPGKESAAGPEDGSRFHRTICYHLRIGWRGEFHAPSISSTLYGKRPEIEDRNGSSNRKRNSDLRARAVRLSAMPVERNTSALSQWSAADAVITCCRKYPGFQDVATNQVEAGEKKNFADQSLRLEPFEHQHHVGFVVRFPAANRRAVNFIFAALSFRRIQLHLMSRDE